MIDLLPSPAAVALLIVEENGSRWSTALQFSSGQPDYLIILTLLDLIVETKAHAQDHSRLVALLYLVAATDAYVAGLRRSLVTMAQSTSGFRDWGSSWP